MRVDRISYQKIFPTGMMYLNHKIGVEIQVDEEDDWQEAFEMAKRVVEKWNLESNPGMAAGMEYMVDGESIVESFAPPIQQQEKTPLTKEEALKLLIKKDCSTKQLLELQRKQVERLGNEEITNLFNEKMKTFK